MIQTRSMTNLKNIDMGEYLLDMVKKITEKNVFETFFETADKIILVEQICPEKNDRVFSDKGQIKYFLDTIVLLGTILKEEKKKMKKYYRRYIRISLLLELMILARIAKK